MDILKLEIFGADISVRYIDGAREEISGGIFESKDPEGDKIAKRIATPADIARLSTLAATYEASVVPLEALVVAKQVVGGFIEITYDDGRKEKIGLEGYEIKDAANNTIFQRPATAADQTRLAGLDVGETGAGTPGTGDPIVVNGTIGDDRLEGTGVSDILNGLAGDDRLRGRGGDDTVNGGDGDDLVRGDFGNDEVNGGAGADTVRGGFGDDSISGGDGNDLARGDEGNDTVSGGDGDDRARGGDGDDLVNGDGGNDRADGGLGNDTVFGGTGDDTVKGDAGNDRLDGGAGVDTYDGGLGADVLVFGVDGAAERVKSFEDGIDLMDVSAFGLTTIAGLGMTQVGLNVLIDFGGGDVIRIDNITVAQVTDADFIF